MLKISKLYRPFHLSGSYKDIQEERILTSLYAYHIGHLDVVISRLINDAVLNHMNLYIDSTIMQMHALNEYLVSLFKINLEALLFNYCIHYLEESSINELDESVVKEIEHIVEGATIKTDLDEIIQKVEALTLTNN